MIQALLFSGGVCFLEAWEGGYIFNYLCGRFGVGRTRWVRSVGLSSYVVNITDVRYSTAMTELKIPVISHDDQTLGPEVCVTPNNAYDAWPIATIQIHCNHLDWYV